MRIFPIALLFVSVASSAGTLAPDSLLCETAETLVFAKNSAPGRSATDVLKGANAYVQFAEVSKQSAQTFATLAAKESLIAGNRYAKHGTTGQLAQQSQDRADRTAAEALQYAAVVNACASSGSSHTAAEIIERKPISGVAKVRTTFKGATVELYVSMHAVTD